MRCGRNVSITTHPTPGSPHSPDIGSKTSQSHAASKRKQSTRSSTRSSPVHGSTTRCITAMEEEVAAATVTVVAAAVDLPADHGSTMSPITASEEAVPGTATMVATAVGLAAALLIPMVHLQAASAVHPIPPRLASATGRRTSRSLSTSWEGFGIRHPTPQAMS